MKRFILMILCVTLIFTVYSCSDDKAGSSDATNLANILKSYRDNSMTSWWDILAVYNADENPVDYPGFDKILVSLEEGKTTLNCAGYVIVTNIAVIIGADEGYFEEYNNFKGRLKELLENPGSGTVNDYIFSYYALKTSGEAFDEEPVKQHLESKQKDDGGFALSGDSGDADVTAFAIPALHLMDFVSLGTPVEFLKNNINEDGTFSSWGNANANSTACALSALVPYRTMYDDVNETVKQAQNGLSLFEKSGGYSFLQDEERNALATTQGAIALGDLKNGTNVWLKLYLDSLDAFDE